MTTKTAVKLWNYYHDALCNGFYTSKEHRDYMYQEYEKLCQHPKLKHRIRLVINSDN